MTAKIHPDLVDHLIRLYCDWREECAEVAAAYDRFSRAEPGDRALAHAAYVAALDREEAAARTYGYHVELIVTADAERRSRRPAGVR